MIYMANQLKFNQGQSGDLGRYNMNRLTKEQRECKEKGKACSYGICDECPLNQKENSRNDEKI